uniref:Uncharacterized protein n=1 Tax=Amphimedon queenslandica TaxID=400682 RepID=A0A1X7TF66_AMPQE
MLTLLVLKPSRGLFFQILFHQQCALPLMPLIFISIFPQHLFITVFQILQYLEYSSHPSNCQETYH